MTNKEAIEELMFLSKVENNNGSATWPIVSKPEQVEALKLAINALESKRPQWVPITYKKPTDEEKEEMREVYDVDDIDAVYTCPLPDNGQKVLITTRVWRAIEITTFYNDVDGSYFEDWEDIDEVAAWMPLMEPYKEEGETND